MLRPKKTEFKKYHRRKMNKTVPNNTDLHFGTYGIKATSTGEISSRTIETARRTITRLFKRKGKVFIRIFPDLPITAKPAEVRMGKGVGAVSYWVAVVKPGQILFEFEGVDQALAKEATKSLINTLNVKIKFVMNGNLSLIN